MFLLLLGCGPGGGDPAPGLTPVGESPALYDEMQVLEVSLTLEAADWEALRNQTRSIWDTYSGDCLGRPFESPFDWYTADATVNGVALGPVGVRKKGFLGSLEAERPSLKLELDREHGDTSLDGFTKITLNNGHEDPTRLHTCLAYRAFTAAGVPAPRCTLAHVTVNGEDLGVYANVEPVDQAFLSSRDLSPDGGLFEGTLSDFRQGWVGTFDPKTDTSDVSALDRVTTAIETGRLDAIGDVVDLDAYLTFWATEVLVGQWDGYSANTNNFFVYDNPATGRIQFIPWGPDAAFDSATPSGAAWVAANSALARAVLLAPGGEEAFRARLRALLENVWDGQDMLAEVNRLARLAAPWRGAASREHLNELRDIVSGRENALLAVLEAEPTAWNGALRNPPCFLRRGYMSATFTTTWATLGESPWTTGAMTLGLLWDDAIVPVTPAGAIAGQQDQDALVAAAAGRPDGSYFVTYAWFPIDQLETGLFPFDFVDAVGVLLYSDGTAAPALAAYIEGGVTYDAVGSHPGAAVEGRMTGTLWSYGW